MLEINFESLLTSLMEIIYNLIKMGCKDKKAKKAKKCVLYYDTNDKTGNFVFSKTATHKNTDGSTFESKEIQSRIQ